MINKFLLFVFGIMVFNSLHLCGQTITYDYDDSGNRIKRYIVLDKKSAYTDNAYTNDTSALDKEKVVDELSEVKVTIYPNPTHERLNVELSGLNSDLPLEYQLYSQTGVLLQSRKSIGNPFTIDFSTYPTGIYILILKYKDSKSDWKVFKK